MNPALFPLVYLEQSRLEEQGLNGCALELWSAVQSSSQWPMPNGVAVPIEMEAWGHSSQAKLFELLRAEEGVLQVLSAPHYQPIYFSLTDCRGEGGREDYLSIHPSLLFLVVVER